MNQDSNLIYQKESVLKIDPAAIAHNYSVILSLIHIFKQFDRHLLGKAALVNL